MPYTTDRTVGVHPCSNPSHENCYRVIVYRDEPFVPRPQDEYQHVHRGELEGLLDVVLETNRTEFVALRMIL